MTMKPCRANYTDVTGKHFRCTMPAAAHVADSKHFFERHDPLGRRALLLSTFSILLTLAIPLVGVFGGYTFGKADGQVLGYGEGYKDGMELERHQLAVLVKASETMTGPLDVTEEMDCETLSLVAARAGALLGLQMVSKVVGEP